MSASAPPQHSRVPSLAAPLTASLPAGGRGEAEEIRRAPGGKVVTLGPQQHSTDVARGGGPDSVAQVGYCLQAEQIPRRPTRNRSGTGLSCSPKVTRSALPCGAGSISSSSSIGTHRLVQRRERELHLRLDSGDANEAAVRSPLGQVL